ncbi:unnamed protein product, partial [Mesorhabditis belari]|uniref:Brix domain-containing protein n=1 Tax=Mesorhabditis belari TaxID=2138241 RepID=A0AAF3J808_9BILA
MGRAKGRRGKAARRARAGDLGLGQMKRKTKGQFAKAADRRAEADEKKRDVKHIKEQAASVASKAEAEKVPHSFVIYRGEVGRFVHRLVRDLRFVMEPNTAKDLKVRKSNNLRDFVVNGAPLGVTQMMVLTRGTKDLHLRMIRLPQGPTLTFRVQEYTLKRQVLSRQKKQMWCDTLFSAAPLVVMNGFKTADQKRHLQVVQTMVQNMFPSLNVDTVQLKAVRRCLLLNYDPETDTIDMRHYAIKTVTSGLAKPVKKLVSSKIPDLSRYKDISDFFINPGQLSESEWEEEQKEVDLPQDIFSRGLSQGQKSNIRLLELGPRLKLELVKVQEGIDEGEVLYHKFVQKTADEVADLKNKAPRIRKLQERRRKDQEHRVIRRLTAIDERKKKDEEAIKERTEKAARKQAEVTGQTEDVEVDRKRDREIEIEREREESEKVPTIGKKKGRGGGEGQNVSQEPPTKKNKKEQKGSTENGKVKSSRREAAH